MELRLDGRTLFAVIILAAGVFFAVQTAGMTVSLVYARVGPTFFPILVSAGLLVTGALLMFEAVTHPTAPIDDGKLDFGAMLWIAISLGVYIAVIGTVGFVIASALLFAAVCRAFASRRIAVDLTIGTVLSLAVFIAFTEGLGMGLSAGPLALIGLGG